MHNTLHNKRPCLSSAIGLWLNCEYNKYSEILLDMAKGQQVIINNYAHTISFNEVPIRLFTWTRILFNIFTF